MIWNSLEVRRKRCQIYKCTSSRCNEISRNKNKRCTERRRRRGEKRRTQRKEKGELKSLLKNNPPDVDHLGGTRNAQGRKVRLGSCVTVARTKGSRPVRPQEVDRRLGLIKEIPWVCRRACFPRVDLFSRSIFFDLTMIGRQRRARCDFRRQIDGICIFKRHKLSLPRRCSDLVSRLPRKTAG